jgi:hypothetical protein
MTCDKHEWVVFSTALKDRCLMLQCVRCGLYATVDDPSGDEWAEAFHAPSKPYRWHDGARVVIHGEQRTDLRYTQRRPPTAKRCECYSNVAVPEPGDYERVWVEFIHPKPDVTAEARKELLELADLADGADDLCSTFFPLFVESYQRGAGSEPACVVRWFAGQVEKLAAKGAHCSSAVIATLLREVAKP